MIELQHLADIESIKQLKARYFLCVDTKTWDGWRTDVFAPDGILDVPEIRSEPYVGIDAILELLVPLLDGVKTVHHGHMPIITITGPATATGIWTMEDVLFWPESRYEGTAAGRMHGYGIYYEDYVKLDRGWRIKRLRLERLHYGPL